VTAIITMIGEYGEIIGDGPYILEEVINSWDNKDEKVRNQLLVSTLKLFFKRPKEVKPILGKLFKVATEDSLHPDVHDRALFFYRLLSSKNGANIDRCKQILSHGSTYVDQFVEELDGFEVDRLFEEFDTLAVIYGEGSERFLNASGAFLDEEVPVEELRRKEEEEEEYYRKREEQLRADFETETSEDGTRPGSYHAPQVSVGTTYAIPKQVQFNASALLDPPTFERTWKTLPIVKKYQAQYMGTATDPQQIDSVFLSHHIKSVAKGSAGGVLRFFLYAQEVQSAALFLVELVINPSSRQVTANIKSTNELYVAQFEVTFQALLQQL